MKDQYTAADMASAAAQGFRDGIKHALDICKRLSGDIGDDFSCAAEVCADQIIEEIQKEKND